MPVRTSSAFASSLTGVALLVLVGCHSAGSSASSAPTGHSTGSSASVPDAPTGAAEGSTAAAPTQPVDVCALMPLATAKSLTGEPFTNAYTEVEAVPVPNYACDYQEAGSKLAVASLIVIPAKGVDWYNRPASDPSSKPYAGLGDKAVYNLDPQIETKVTLVGLFGSTAIEFDDFTDNDSTNAKAAAVIRAAAVKLQLSR